MKAARENNSKFDKRAKSQIFMGFIVLVGNHCYNRIGACSRTKIYSERRRGVSKVKSHYIDFKSQNSGPFFSPRALLSGKGILLIWKRIPIFFQESDTLVI